MGVTSNGTPKGDDDDHKGIKSTHGKVPYNGIKYAFSINPDDGFQCYDMRPCDYVGGTRLHHAANKLRDQMFLLIRQYAKYEMYTEVSMKWEGIPHQRPRVHAHGYITFNNVTLFMSEVADRLRCTYKICEITDQQKWEDYIFKSRAEIEPNLPRDLYCIRSTDPPSITTQLVGKSIEECFNKAPSRRKRRMAIDT